MISEANIITWVFACIREFFDADVLYEPRWRINDFEAVSRFQGFTEGQVRKYFPDKQLEGLRYYPRNGGWIRAKSTIF